jgi:hypothetical protein
MRVFLGITRRRRRLAQLVRVHLDQVVQAAVAVQEAEDLEMAAVRPVL